MAMSKIIELETQLDTKQTLEMEIQELKGKLQVMKHLGDADDVAVKQKMKEMNDELEDKKSDLEQLEKMNSGLMTKEQLEIQAARKTLIAVHTLAFFFLPLRPMLFKLWILFSSAFDRVVGCRI